MRIGKVSISQIQESDTFLVPYHIDIVPVRKKYQNFLNKNLKDCPKIPFKELTEKLSNLEVEKGDIILKNHPNGKLIFEIAKNKKKETFYSTIYRVTDKRTSPEHLLWYFSQKQVEDYIKIRASGSFIRIIPFAVFEDILVPIPKVINNKYKRSKLTVSQGTNPIREIIRNFYQDYQWNYDMNQFDTAIILAGAICEAILYESLIEVGVPEKILSRNKTLGTLLEYAQIKELDKAHSISLSHFENIKQHRNKTIHIGSSLKRLESGEIIDKSVFKDFDHIIKNFGI